MPALKPVSGVLRLKLIFSVGSDLTTGFHQYLAYGTVPPTASQLVTMCGSIAGSWNSFLSPMTETATILTSVDAVDLSAPDAAVGLWTGSHPGTRAGSALPAQAALLLNWPILRRYRGGKPRIYIPAGVASDLASPQTWSGTFLTAYATAWNSFESAVAAAINSWGSGAKLVNVSYYLGGEWKQDHLGNYRRIPTPRDTPKVDEIVGANFAPTVATQRRRARGA